MNRKKEYKDMDKFRETKKLQSRRYRAKNGAGKYRRDWTLHEINLVIEHSKPDSELAKEIKRSVGAIQKMRYRVKQGEIELK